LNYTVIWTHQLLSRITGIYITVREAGGDTHAITRAMAEIDRQLERGPLGVGESREFGVRMLVVPPLTVRYEVHDDQHVVVVLTAHYRTPGR
jgi:hypothetical protein